MANIHLISNNLKRINLSICFFFLPLVFLSQTNYLSKAKSYYIIDSNIYYGEKHLEQCLNKSSDSKKVIDAYRYLVPNYILVQKYNKAHGVILQMQQLAKKRSDYAMQYVSIGLLGSIEKYKGNYPKATEYYLQSYNLLEKNKSWDYLCSCAIDFIELNRSVENYKEAEVYIEKSFDIYNQHHLVDSILLARLYNRTAAVKNERAKNEVEQLELINSSITFSYKSLTINKLLKNIDGQAITWNELGYSYRCLNKIDTAEECFIKAEKMWLSIGAYNYAINAMSNRASLYVINNIKNKETLLLYHKIIDIVKQKNVDYDIYLVYKGLSEESFRQGKFKDGQKYLNIYADLYAKKLEKIYHSQIDEVKEKYQNEKIKKEATQVSNELNLSKIALQQKSRENKIIYISMGILTLLFLSIIYLWYQNKKKNQELKQKNKEKDMLIQEVHHRVKNNLQFVSSLISMQINASANNEEAYVLNDTSRRIGAMALVHEMLYNQDDMDGVNIKQYIQELINSINDLVNSEKLKITFKIMCDNLMIDTNKAIAMGVITSELISNSIKYAFTKTENPQVDITIKKEKDEISFVVKDNGSGFAIATTDNHKLGMRLIDIFSRQLKGKHIFENNRGLIYSIQFKV